MSFLEAPFNAINLVVNASATIETAGPAVTVEPVPVLPLVVPPVQPPLISVPPPPQPVINRL